MQVRMNVCDGQIIHTKVGLQNDLVTFHRQDYGIHRRSVSVRN